MKTSRTSNDKNQCNCNVKRRSLFGLIHFQSGVHKPGCVKDTPLDAAMRELTR